MKPAVSTVDVHSREQHHLLALTWRRPPRLPPSYQNTVLRFQERKGLLQGQAGKTASDRYVEVGRAIRDFEKQLHKEWCAEAEERLPSLLCDHVLAFDIQASVASVVAAEQKLKGEVPASAKMVAGTATRESVAVRPVFASLPRLLRFSSMLAPRLCPHARPPPPPCALLAPTDVAVLAFATLQDHPEVLTSHTRLAVNYSQELLDLVAEAKYLDFMGLAVPEAAVNVTLQEEKHAEFIDALLKMVERFHAVVKALDPATERLLRRHLDDLGVVVLPGLQRLNWNSLGIADFAVRCNQALSKFEAILIPVQKNAKDVENTLHAISTATLFQYYSAFPADIRAVVRQVSTGGSFFFSFFFSPGFFLPFFLCFELLF